MDRPALTPHLRRRLLLFGSPPLLLLRAMRAPARAADEPPHILVFGDSQAQGLAGGLQRLFRGDRRYRVLDRSKIGTGLVSHRYDWPAAARKLAGSEHAAVAVALFGANDRPPVRINGVIDAARSAAFQTTYGTRVTEIAATLRDAGVPLIWVGHPIVRNPDYAEDMALLNRIYGHCTVAAGADFVPTWDLFANAGGYTAFGKDVGGETVRLRADDGIHLTPAGYDVLAAHLLPHIASEIALRLRT